MVSAAWTKTCESDHKNMWSSGCGQDNVFSMFVKIQECENVSLHLAAVGVWVGGSLGEYLNWFGHWELKAVDLNMKDMIIQRPSGLLVSSD